MKTLFLTYLFGLSLCLGAVTFAHAQDTSTSNNCTKAKEAMVISREEIKKQVDIAMKEAQRAYQTDKIQKEIQIQVMEAQKQVLKSQEILRKANEETLKALKNIDMESIRRNVQQAMDSVSKVMGSMGPQ